MPQVEMYWLSASAHLHLMFFIKLIETMRTAKAFKLKAYNTFTFNRFLFFCFEIKSSNDKLSCKSFFFIADMYINALWVLRLSVNDDDVGQ